MLYFNVYTFFTFCREGRFFLALEVSKMAATYTTLIQMNQSLRHSCLQIIRTFTYLLHDAESFLSS